MRKIIPLVLLFLSSQLKAQITPTAFTTFNYTNNKCSGFTHANGSLLYVPNNSFCYEDGSACKDSIVLKYRELHSQTDMFVNKLNMFVKRNGKNQMLESAGMFEIKAECNGKPLKICQGKTIQVRFKSKRNLSNLQAFKYDFAQNIWVDYGKVFDFSYNKKNPPNTSNLWGNANLPAADTADYNLENEGYNSTAIVWGEYLPLDLPDGVFKGMNINAIGIYNYDAVINEQNAIAFVPDFSVNSGNEIGEICVAYEKKNTLVKYYPDDFAERFVLLNEKGIKIFTQLSDGSFAVLKEGTLDAIDLTTLKGTTFKMVLEKQPLKPKNIAELAKVTKMNAN